MTVPEIHSGPSFEILAKVPESISLAVIPTKNCMHIFRHPTDALGAQWRKPTRSFYACEKSRIRCEDCNSPFLKEPVGRGTLICCSFFWVCATFLPVPKSIPKVLFLLQESREMIATYPVEWVPLFASPREAQTQGLQVAALFLHYDTKVLMLSGS